MGADEQYGGKMSGLPEGFQLDQPSQAAADPSLPQGFHLDEPAPTDLPPGFQLDDEKFGSPGQQTIAGLEGAAKGLAGPAATLAETKVLGIKPEDIRAREEANPITHGVGEAGGFGLGMYFGTGEAALIARAGEGAAHVAQLGEAATTGAKLAKGAVTAATEMGLLQAGDEYSKYLENAPQTPGSVVSNIGLAALLGGVAGPAFTGLGLAATKMLDSTVLKEFMDRLAFRRANIDPNEMMRSEAENAVGTYNSMNNEITGANGLKSQAIQKLLPQEITPEISSQIESVSQKAQEAIEKLSKRRCPRALYRKTSKRHEQIS